MGVHAELMQLIVGYTLTGALVFTVIATCLSLIGWVKFADQAQQNKLFYALIVEVVIMSVGAYAGMLKLDAHSVEQRIRRVEQYDTMSRALNRYVFIIRILEEFLEKNWTTKPTMVAHVTEYNEAITDLHKNKVSFEQLIQIHPDKDKVATFKKIMQLVGKIDKIVHEDLNDELEKVNILGTKDKIDPKIATAVSIKLKPLIAKLGSLVEKLLALGDSN
jgi:hypothetical protein